ncbi:MAG: PHB depolymerase family esterase, partial [Rhodothermales bacterium]
MKITNAILLSFFLASAVSAQEGQLEEMGFVHNDVLRLYQLYVPAAYDDNEAWPLVINLHGATSNPGGQIFVSGMNAVADTARFLVVYPWGLLNQYGDSGWNDHLFA